MGDRVRVRFAPSPTGEPHVGNIRTAIFDWLFARRNRGSLIIRIEDTDQARKVEGATEELLEALRWLGIDWDEGPDVGGDYGPYVQSQRLESYHRAVAELLEKGRAYRCYCSPERLAEMRQEQQRNKVHGGYDRRCRYLSPEERRDFESEGVPAVARFAMPLDGETELTDAIRGEVSFENGLLDDFVLLKSDGFPTYHLASVVDDHAMEISHVLRAEEWLPSAPRHLNVYDALGWEPPVFAHLPMILAPDRSKMSKRHGATSILDYRARGYLPQTIVNFLALLGWSLDDKTEIMSVKELTESFSLERVSRSGAIFDADKLSWMNGHYIRQMSGEELAGALLDFWGRYQPAEIPRLPEASYLLRIVPLIQERLKALADAAPLIPFFFAAEVTYDTGELVQKRMDASGTKAALNRAFSSLRDLPGFDGDSIEGVLRPLADELGIKVGQLFGTLRVATTGLKVSPPLFETMEVLGRERTLAAIKAAVERL
jgi:glutamyl-tRNA synthetase